MVDGCESRSMARALGGLGGARTTSSSRESRNALLKPNGFGVRSSSQWGEYVSRTFFLLNLRLSDLTCHHHPPTTTALHTYDHGTGTARQYTNADDDTNNNAAQTHNIAINLCEDGLVLPKDSPFLGELQTVSVPETSWFCVCVSSFRIRIQQHSISASSGKAGTR